MERAVICFGFDIWHRLHLIWSFKLNTQPLGKYAYFIRFNNDIDMNNTLEKYVAHRHYVSRMLSKFLSTHHHRARWINPLNSRLIAACCMFSKLICSISFHFSVSHFPFFPLFLCPLSVLLPKPVIITSVMAIIILICLGKIHNTPVAYVTHKTLLPHKIV